MSSSGFGMNGNGNGQFPSGQQGAPYPTWMLVNNNNHVNFFMYGNQGPATPGGIPAPVPQPHVEPPTGHWPCSLMGPIHQTPTAPGYGMLYHGQASAPWNGHSGQKNGVWQGLANPGISGEYFNYQFGSNGVGTQRIMVVPTSALFDKSKEMEDINGQGGGGMGGFGQVSGAGAFVF